MTPVPSDQKQKFQNASERQWLIQLNNKNLGFIEVTPYFKIHVLINGYEATFGTEVSADEILRQVYAFNALKGLQAHEVLDFANKFTLLWKEAKDYITYNNPLKPEFCFSCIKGEHINKPQKAFAYIAGESNTKALPTKYIARCIVCGEERVLDLSGDPQTMFLQMLTPGHKIKPQNA